MVDRCGEGLCWHDPHVPLPRQFRSARSLQHGSPLATQLGWIRDAVIRVTREKQSEGGRQAGRQGRHRDQRGDHPDRREASSDPGDGGLVAVAHSGQRHKGKPHPTGDSRQRLRWKLFAVAPPLRQPDQAAHHQQHSDQHEDRRQHGPSQKNLQSIQQGGGLQGQQNAFLADEIGLGEIDPWKVETIGCDADRPHQQINLPVVQGKNSLLGCCLLNQPIGEVVVFSNPSPHLEADSAAATLLLDHKGGTAADAHLERPCH